MSKLVISCFELNLFPNGWQWFLSQYLSTVRWWFWHWLTVRVFSKPMILCQFALIWKAECENRCIISLNIIFILTMVCSALLSIISNLLLKMFFLCPYFLGFEFVYTNNISIFISTYFKFWPRIEKTILMKASSEFIIYSVSINNQYCSW